MGRKPVKCSNCGVYLSSKGRDTPGDKPLCNRCGGTNYNPKTESGRKILH